MNSVGPRFVITFLYLILFQSSYADIIKLSQARSEYLIGKQVDYFVDSSAQYAFADLHQMKFRPSKNLVLGGGFSHANYWIRFKVEPQRGNDKQWLLACNNFFLDSLTMYYIADDGQYKSKTSGLSIMQSQREIHGTSLALSLPSSAFNDYIYLKASSNDFINIPLRLVTKEAYFKNELHQHIVSGFFVGVLALFLIYTMILFVRKKYEKTLLFLAAYTFVSLLMGLEFEGINHLYLWPEYLFIYQWSSSLILDAILLTMIPFVYLILDIRNLFPRLKYFFIGLYVLVIFKIASIAFVDRLTMTFINQFPSGALLIFFVLGIIVWRKGNKNGLLFSVGWGVYFLSMMPYLLKNTGDLDSTIFTENSPLFGTVVEIICLSIAAMRLVHQIEEKNAVKDKFFSIIAHDLKNPLSAFGSITQSLLDSHREIKPAEMEYFLRKLTKSSGEMNNLLKNLLEWAMTQSGGLSYNPGQHAVKELVEEILQPMELNAEVKKITIDHSELGENNVYADKAMVLTILRNLVSNAIKFTPTGGHIFITSERKENRLHIQVGDNGVGIAREAQNRLFKLGSLPAENAHAEAGTGLGLALCKELIEKNDGSIWVISEPGQGSTFIFTLPLTDAEAEVSRKTA